MTFSVPTLDPDIWRTTEPGTAPPRQRLRALRTLVDAGVRAGVGVAPILPGLSDRPDLLADVVKAARDAGAVSLWANVLYLRPGTREHFLDHLARDWPELLPRYERLYAGRAYLDKPATEPIQRRVRELRTSVAIADRRSIRPEEGRRTAAEVTVAHEARPSSPPGRSARRTRRPEEPIERDRPPARLRALRSRPRYPSAMAQLARKIPLAELHCHLGGAVTPAIMWGIAHAPGDQAADQGLLGVPRH